MKKRKSLLITCSLLLAMGALAACDSKEAPIADGDASLMADDGGIADEAAVDLSETSDGTTIADGAMADSSPLKIPLIGVYTVNRNGSGLKLLIDTGHREFSHVRAHPDGHVEVASVVAHDVALSATPHPASVFDAGRNAHSNALHPDLESTSVALRAGPLPASARSTARLALDGERDDDAANRLGEVEFDFGADIERGSADRLGRRRCFRRQQLDHQFLETVGQLGRRQ